MKLSLRGNEAIHKLALILILIFNFLNCNSQAQREIEEKIRLEINTEFDKNISRCSLNVDAITDFNGKTEFWKICNLGNGSRIIQIESHYEDFYYQEIYFEKNGELIYAKEAEIYLPKNHYAQMTWNCEFYAKSGKLIALISLGHGKTEDEEWNPDVIFEMHKSRLIELVKIKK